MALQEAGAAMIVLEMVPDRVAEADFAARCASRRSASAQGVGCDGQVLVLHDMLGIFDRFTPKFVKKYAELFPQMEARAGRLSRRRGRPALPGCRAQFSDG